jgi:ubiquitin carboxyl-terminal hydrolase 4/11/15
MYDQEYVDAVVDDVSTTQAEAEPESKESRNAASVPLAACVDAFTEVEHMQVESGNGVKCEKCNKTVDAEKKIEIWREPDVLLLHIKRFHFSGEHFEKISTSVEVPPRDLDIRPWIVGPTGLSSTMYDLYGVACHRGGMSGGHYTSYCMNEGGKEPTWLKFNDDTVTRVNLQQELQEINKQCYVLFYRKRAFSSSNLINYLSL